MVIVLTTTVVAVIIAITSATSTSSSPDHLIIIRRDQLGAFFWAHAASGSAVYDDDVGRRPPVRLFQVADVADDATRILQLLGSSAECQALRVVSFEDEKYLHFKEAESIEDREVSYSSEKSYFLQNTNLLFIISK